MAHVPKIKRLKWNKKAEKYIHLGYAENTKGYRLYNPANKSIITSRDVVIMEVHRDSDMRQAVVEKNENESLTQVEKQDLSVGDLTDDTYIPESVESQDSCSKEFCDTVSDNELL
ncbi:Retrovirus-related Pol polyprotein from transposon TNT 1-94 [Eumeta japonica]|uniref:Retrovirus-related Pol polyprotein from transposon TNT 1-94 n=1 Tax=Eumeta variegata TaxID=151549 RepID=A0A4C1UDC6_EUMVA|nr:Retrovirus-related Pol polyprotein from transposon TNT 1-94 [Eumeta japonica]